ncbi:MAG: hypothetical protein FWB91_04450 [Defluviitaleaceae bacterium]|nr:hypothetical protein [Defluviitaleaceae bacterium]
MKYFIGIDGGGSFSRLAAIDAGMDILGYHSGGATNVASGSYESVRANITALLRGFNAETGTNLSDCGAIYMGSAGAKVPGNAQKLEHIFREAGFSGVVKIVSDAEILLAAETRGQPGIILISGTGSVGFAVDKNGEVFRVGGWGHLICDGGSGYRIGMDAIRAAFADYDGSGPKTTLTEMIMQTFELAGLEDFLHYIYSADFNKAKIARAALLVKAASDEGDKVAVGIESHAADNLIRIAGTLIKKVGLDAHKLVISGSVIVLYERIRQKLCRAVERDFPSVTISEARERPELGAAYLAYANHEKKFHKPSY